MTLGDRLIVMNDGYAEQIGSPMEIYEKPATTFVAGFFGSPAMNFIDVRTSDGKQVESNSNNCSGFIAWHPYGQVFVRQVDNTD